MCQLHREGIKVEIKSNPPGDCRGCPPGVTPLFGPPDLYRGSQVCAQPVNAPDDH